MSDTTSVLKYGDKEFLLTYVLDSNLQDLTPVTQVYGIVFNKHGEILICRTNPDDKWQIPGGTPETGESQLETLTRELIEEADVTIKASYPLAYQKVEELISGVPGPASYQLRYVGILDEMLDQTIDPDDKKNVIWERRFVPASEITNFVKWGSIGEVMFRDAIELFKSVSK